MVAAPPLRQLDLAYAGIFASIGRSGLQKACHFRAPDEECRYGIESS
jgi:hypothetical protein